MTSFTNRIKPDSTELERYFLSVYTGNLWDALEKIKDWHSPDHIEKEVQMKLLKIQQQALPVVPSFVADWYEFHMNGTFSAVITAYAFAGDDKAVAWLGQNGGMDLLCKMKLYGYTVEKPQLFKLIFPNSTAVLQKDGELNSFADTVYKRYLIKNAMTEQEIKSIDERYWQFAVPVEDGE